MAATFNFVEDNGPQTGSPLHGTTRSGFDTDPNYPTDFNFKNVDDCTANSGTVYSAAPIAAGSNSFPKYIYCKFTGTFNEILNAKWSPHTAGSLGTGLTLVGKVTSTYITPAITALSGTTDYTSVVAIGSGASFSFSITGPEDVAPTAILTEPGYSQYTVSQLQTSGSTSSGDSTTITGNWQYDEN